MLTKNSSVGARKLARILVLTQKRWHESLTPSAASETTETSSTGPVLPPPESVTTQLSEEPSNQTATPLTTPPLAPDLSGPSEAETAFLLVDDNKINLKVRIEVILLQTI